MRSVGNRPQQQQVGRRENAIRAGVSVVCGADCRVARTAIVPRPFIGIAWHERSGAVYGGDGGVATLFAVPGSGAGDTTTGDIGFGRITKPAPPMTTTSSLRAEQ